MNIGESWAPLNGFPFLIFFLGKKLRSIVVLHIVGCTIYCSGNKITTVLIDLTQSAVSSDTSWYVFLFICAPLEGTLEQPWGTSELLFLIIITAIINTNRKKYKEICFI